MMWACIRTISMFRVVWQCSPFQDWPRKIFPFQVRFYSLLFFDRSANVTHTVVYRPKPGVWGRFNFTSGSVTYKSEGSSETQLGLTSEPGEGYIVSLKEFDRRFSPHVLDWLVFFFMTSPSLLIPFLLWFKSKSKYEKIIEAKNASKTAKLQ